MFPNPQDALPLPSRPDLEQYRKLAKELVKACKDGSIGAWAARWEGRAARQIEEFARRQMAERCTLATAQFVLARAHGFASWPAFAKHLRAPHSVFEQAAEAIVSGDAATLARLLREVPGLVRERSAREHRATLLHYVAANGVENYRQTTPKNIAEIATMLLDAGAEVDAAADVYGGGCTTLGLAATSVHPEAAGVQEELLDVLLRHGAALEKRSAGGRHSLIVACLANGRRRAAEYLAGRGAPLDLEGAAGVGRLDVVQHLAPSATGEQRTRALRWACGYGRRDVAEFLLDQGADLQAADDQGQTPLHHAAMGGHAEIAKLLLQRGAPLAVRNVYGGTVLGQALWSAAHGGDPDAFAELIEVLIAAGAEPRE